MSIVTKQLKKEVVRYEYVDQIVGYTCTNNYGNTLKVCSNYGKDNEENLLYARNGIKNSNGIAPIIFEVSDDNGDSQSVSISLKQVKELSHSLHAMIGFLEDPSTYTVD